MVSLKTRAMSGVVRLKAVLLIFFMYASAYVMLYGRRFTLAIK